MPELIFHYRISAVGIWLGHVRERLTRVEYDVSSSTTFVSLITLEIQILIDDAQRQGYFHAVIMNHSFFVRHSLKFSQESGKELSSLFQVLLNVSRSLFDFPAQVVPLLLPAIVVGAF